MSKKQKLSIVTVCYNEEKNLEQMYKRVTAVMKTVPDMDYELVYVDNTSTDNSSTIYQKLCAKDQRVKVLIMSRNTRSSQTSYLAGLKYASGDCAVLLDGDIQDPPELIPKMLNLWKDDNDVIYGVRKKRQEGPLLRLGFKAFYRVFNHLAYFHIPLDAGDFSLIDRKVINRIIKFEEKDFYLRGIRAYAGFRQIGMEYEREARTEGNSKANILSYFEWAKHLIVSFSFKPLELISKLAFMVMFFAFLILAVNIVMYFINPDQPRGIPTIMVLVVFLGGIQLLCLSIIAEYLAKIFIEVKNRPRYIVSNIMNDDETKPEDI